MRASVRAVEEMMRDDDENEVLTTYRYYSVGRYL